MKKIINVLTGALGYLLLVPLGTSAAVFDENTIISSASDGSALLFNCDAPTLPFLADQGFIVDPSASIGTVPNGDPIQVITIDFTGGFTIDGNIWNAAFTCETPAANLCVGFDCVNGEVFGDTSVKLKENNTRLTMLDSDVAENAGQEAVLGEKWNIEANGTSNGGENYFGIQVKSSIHDSALSNGVQINYLCDEIEGVGFPITTIGFDFPSDGFVPYGQPFKLVKLTNPIVIISPGIYDWECVNPQFVEQPEPPQFPLPFELIPTVIPSLVMGRNYEEQVDDGSGGFTTELFVGNVIIGTQPRSFQPGADSRVMAGTDALKRQLKFVADAIASTDLVNLRSMKLPRIEMIKAQIAAFNVKLDKVQSKINVILRADINGDGCIDRSDYILLSTELRKPVPDIQYDLDGNGVVNRIDLRALITLFSNPRGAPCL